jgi:hypothetical protein
LLFKKITKMKNNILNFLKVKFDHLSTLKKKWAIFEPTPFFWPTLV